MSVTGIQSPGRLEEAGSSSQAVSAAVAFSKDSEFETRLAACRAAGSLVAAEATQKLPQGSALRQLMTVFLALLGPGQSSDVQRQQMQVCKLTLHSAVYAPMCVLLTSL